MFEPELVYKVRGIAFDVYNNIVGSWDEETHEDIIFDALIDKGLYVERQKEFEVISPEVPPRRDSGSRLTRREK